MAEVDLANRDPNQLHDDSMNVMFQDVLGEPPSFRSMDCVWTNSAKCYSLGLKFSYVLSTCFCGICTALGWGCTYGCLGFATIWFMLPFFKCYNIVMAIARKIFSSIIDAFVGPCFETAGLILSKIAIKQIKE
mmetsp:Transcript_1816/g.4071  ORF Transcript_1816/g.4071 Transcript_1816/m.4071 type:complete len:133 (-) Transcript_1816:108-506(-)